MRSISKGAEPPSLTRHRLSSHADYDNYPDKDTLRRALTDEQRGICCYCMGRIHPHATAMKIEHWHCQTDYPAEQLDYRNLLAACPGHPHQPEAQTHCDTHKGNRPLSFNPADPGQRIEALLRFAGDGTIRADREDIDRELNEVLNLNLALLKNKRKATLDGFIQTLSKRQGELPAAELRRWLSQWDGSAGPGELRPYCQVVVYWLQKKLAKK